MNDKRILAYLALGLLVGGLLGAFVIALLGGRELAVGFAVVAELLALVFGALSYSERIGKIVTVMGVVLAVTAVATTAVLIPIREKQATDRREESKKQLIQVSKAMHQSAPANQNVADAEAKHSQSAGDRVGVDGDGDKVKQSVPDRASNSYYLYTKALSATESGVVAVPSRFKWSIETSWSGIDAQGKDLPDTRVMMRLYDPEHNFTALTAQMDLATAEKLQRELADIIAEKRKNADYQYRPQLYDSSLIPTGEIKGIDRNGELIIELKPTNAK